MTRSRATQDEKTTHAKSPLSQDSKTFAYPRHAALVRISKWPSRLLGACKLCRNQPTDIPPLLDGDLAIPGRGRPSCSTAAASPTTKTPATFGRFIDVPTYTRPARSVFSPSILARGDAATPAVHTTVAHSMRLPATTTPLS